MSVIYDIIRISKQDLYDRLKVLNFNFHDKNNVSTIIHLINVNQGFYEIDEDEASEILNDLRKMNDLERNRIDPVLDEQMMTHIEHKLTLKNHQSYESFMSDKFAKYKKNDELMIGSRKAMEWYKMYNEMWSQGVPETNSPKASLPSQEEFQQMRIDELLISNLSKTGSSHLSKAEFLEQLPKANHYHTPIQLYNEYEKLYKYNNPVKKVKTPVTSIPEMELQYPFKSKKPLIPIKDNEQFILKDYKAARIKRQLQRISFSPIPKVFEADIFEVHTPDGRRQYYLFIQNINTRFLHVYPANGKSVLNLSPIFEQFIREEHPYEIRADGEAAFNAEKMNQLFDRHKVKTNFNSSPYLYHVKIIDSTMKTVRDGFGENYRLMLNNENMQQMVYFYNNTPNRNTKISPVEMETYPELEQKWITHCTLINQEQKMKQNQAKLLSYKPGNVVIIHLDKSKTRFKFDKSRRSFNYLAVFNEYKGGNAKISLLNNQLIPYKKELEIPIYFTHKVAEDIYDLSNHQNILNTLNIDNAELENLNTAIPIDELPN
jgi:hypothetical protein